MPAAKLAVISSARNVMLESAVIFWEIPAVQVAIVPGTENGTLNPAAMFCGCHSTGELSEVEILMTE